MLFTKKTEEAEALRLKNLLEVPLSAIGAEDAGSLAKAVERMEDLERGCRGAKIDYERIRVQFKNEGEIKTRLKTKGLFGHEIAILEINLEKIRTENAKLTRDNANLALQALARAAELEEEYELWSEAYKQASKKEGEFFSQKLESVLSLAEELLLEVKAAKKEK